jgi:hypothetical protein
MVFGDWEGNLDSGGELHLTWDDITIQSFRVPIYWNEYEITGYFVLSCSIC